MYWADYRKDSKKAKIHLGFDLNHGIPSKIHFTNGKEAERPFVDPIISAGQTVVADRGYQKHALFDHLQAQGKHFVIRIRANTTKTIIKENNAGPTVSFFSMQKCCWAPIKTNNNQKNRHDWSDTIFLASING